MKNSWILFAILLATFGGIGDVVFGVVILAAIFFFVAFIVGILTNPVTPNIEGKKPSNESVEVVERRKSRRELIDQWVINVLRNFPELKNIRWDWADAWTGEKIIFTTCGDGLTYEGTLSFAEPGDADCYDQPRVTGCKSVLKGTDIKREWNGTELSRVPLSSISKNIANSFKNDKKLRKVIEEAYLSCLEVGSGIIELDDIDLDFTDKRVVEEFAKICLSSGNFSSVHLLSNGHQLKVFVGDADPI